MMFINDMLRGTGILERSLLFIGFYPPYIQYLHYPLALVYYSQASLIYIIYMIYAVSVVGAYLKRDPWAKNQINDLVASKILFASWDWSMHDKNSFHIQRRTIINECTLIVREIDEKNKTTKHQYLWTKRFLAGTLIWLVMVVSCAIVYYLTMISNGTVDDHSEYTFVNFLAPLLGAIGLNVMSSVYPVIFGWIAKLENVDDKMALTKLMMRLLYARTLCLTVVIYPQIYKILTNNDSLSCEYGDYCWETSYGQQIYSLIVIDFIISTTWSLLKLLIFVPCKLLPLTALNNFAVTDFDVPNELMDTIQLQTYALTGMIAMPLIPLVTSGLLLLQISFKFLFSIFFCKPSHTLYRASSSSSLYMWVVVGSFFSAYIPVNIFSFFLPNSPGCSPFRGLPHLSWTLYAYGSAATNLHLYLK